MVWETPIIGRYVRLRSIEDSEEDITFSLDIRQNEKKTRYLHKVENNREMQKNWIQHQRMRQGDYFFIVEELNGKKVGTVGIYDIEGGIGQIGRALMIGNSVETFESQLLAMRFAYEELELEELFSKVCLENMPSIRLGKTMGFHFNDPFFSEEDGAMMYRGRAYKSEFSTYEERISKFIYR